MMIRRFLLPVLVLLFVAVLCDDVYLEIKKRAPVERLIVASLSNDVTGCVCHLAGP